MGLFKRKNGSKRSSNDVEVPKKIADISNMEPSLAHVPQYLHDISTTTTTKGDKPARALRLLFGLSEHDGNASPSRIAMVEQNPTLVPTLLDFLQQCDLCSSEQYLALLVLNNISIPTENKPIIALEYGGAKILSKLLCMDPSCHLMAIILVNITFCDWELRRELVLDVPELVPSLLYTLLLSFMTPDEFESFEEVENDLISEKEASLAACKRPAMLYNSDGRDGEETVSVYPETSKWCLAALKNLTRPGGSGQAAQALVRCRSTTNLLTCLIMLDNQTPSPAFWDSNSVQDAALFIIMNLAATMETRPVIRIESVLQTLVAIAEYRGTDSDMSDVQRSQLDFQALKARMALSYMLGSTGHFGQAPRSKNGDHKSTDEQPVLMLSEVETSLLLEMLANSLMHRGKDGPGGYSASTFNVKWVLYAIRCLLTNPMNQLSFLNHCGTALNSLLLKALAQHSIAKNTAMIDVDAAEHAVFSLYLQSNYGFMTRFLPAFYGNQDNIKGTGCLAAKALTSYLVMESTSPAGKHAAEQILLRFRYLVVRGPISDLVSTTSLVNEADLLFSDKMLAAADQVVVERRATGARPRPEIFDRAILRAKVPAKGDTARAPWHDEDQKSSHKVRVFSSALMAVQDLSFGSNKVRHMDAIDDIAIANNIANSANGEKTESYNFWWSWQDAADEIQRNLSRQRSNDSSVICSKGNMRNDVGKDEPFTFFQCGPCAPPDEPISSEI